VFVYQTSSHSKKNNFYHDRSNRQYTTEIQNMFSSMSSQQYSPIRRYKVQLHMENKQNPRNESNTLTWHITHCRNSITIDKLKNNNIQNFHHVTHLWKLYNNIYIHTRARMHNLTEKLHLVYRRYTQTFTQFLYKLNQNQNQEGIFFIFLRSTQNWWLRN
jgi:hypothetical protein